MNERDRLKRVIFSIPDIIYIIHRNLLFKNFVPLINTFLAGGFYFV